jgi:hypothetical protein
VRRRGASHRVIPVVGIGFALVARDKDGAVAEAEAETAMVTETKLEQCMEQTGKDKERETKML